MRKKTSASGWRALASKNCAMTGVAPSDVKLAAVVSAGALIAGRLEAPERVLKPAGPIYPHRRAALSRGGMSGHPHSDVGGEGRIVFRPGHGRVVTERLAEAALAVGHAAQRVDV